MCMCGVMRASQEEMMMVDCIGESRIKLPKGSKRERESTIRGL